MTQLPSAHRRVHTVSLTAPDQTLVRRGALLLEDALHTASIPAEDGKLLLIRHLNVGKIHPHRSPASLALTVEQCLRQLAARAVPAEHPMAADQIAVYFRDDVEPYSQLALRLATHQPTTAWFWPMAIPHWQPHVPADVALRHLLLQLPQTQTGSGAIAPFLRTLQQHQALMPVLSALRQSDGAALLKAYGWSLPSLPFSLVLPLSGETVGLSAAFRQVLQTQIQQWGATDARSLWLATGLQIAEKPGRILNADLVERSQRLIKQVFQASWLSHGMNGAIAPAPRARDQSEAFTPASVEPPAVLMPAATPPDAPPNPQSEALSAEQEAHHPETPFAPEGEGLGASQFTPFAGLLFLIPLLTQLGIESWLESDPALLEAEFPQQFLHWVGAFAIPATDPIRAAVGDCPAVVSLTQFAVPEQWQQGIVQAEHPMGRQSSESFTVFDDSGRLALAHGPDSSAIPSVWMNSVAIAPGERLAALPLLLSSWKIAARRWLRRYAKIGLHDLICRPGRVAATRTHIDLVFHHHQADIRIRKAGLDLNPGWVPWLGKVVMFHYQHGDAHEP